jgi:hypothetical protein
MKLRLHAGSLRLRLSQSEIARLHEVGRVEDAIVFSPGSQLVYILETGAAPAVAAVFNEANIRILLPKPLAEAWIESDQTGIEASTGTLQLLIEKDFQCLHREPQPGEDPFPNPLASDS